MNQRKLYPITTSELVLLDNNKTLKLNLGSANGIATLNNKGKVPASQLPDSLADITEYDNTASGLEAETVQDAIDELALRPAGSASSSLISCTTDELYELKASNSLISGQEYRVTDYNGSEALQEKGYRQYDVILTAVSSNEFSVDARAMLHDGTDQTPDTTYFNAPGISSWKLKFGSISKPQMPGKQIVSFKYSKDGFVEDPGAIVSGFMPAASIGSYQIYAGGEYYILSEWLGNLLDYSSVLLSGYGEDHMFGFLVIYNPTSQQWNFFNLVFSSGTAEPSPIYDTYISDIVSKDVLGSSKPLVISYVKDEYDNEVNFDFKGSPADEAVPEVTIKAPVGLGESLSYLGEYDSYVINDSNSEFDGKTLGTALDSLDLADSTVRIYTTLGEIFGSDIYGRIVCFDFDWAGSGELGNISLTVTPVEDYTGELETVVLVEGNDAAYLFNEYDLSGDTHNNKVIVGETGYPPLIIPPVVNCVFMPGCNGGTLAGIDVAGSYETDSPVYNYIFESLDVETYVTSSEEVDPITVYPDNVARASDISTLQSQITTLRTTVNTVETTANSAKSTATSASNLAGTNASNISTLNNRVTSIQNNILPYKAKCISTDYEAVSETLNQSADSDIIITHSQFDSIPHLWKLADDGFKYCWISVEPAIGSGSIYDNELQRKAYTLTPTVSENDVVYVERVTFDGGVKKVNGVVTSLDRYDVGQFAGVEQTGTSNGKDTFRITLWGWFYRSSENDLSTGIKDLTREAQMGRIISDVSEISTTFQWGATTLLGEVSSFSDTINGDHYFKEGRTIFTAANDFTISTRYAYIGSLSCIAGHTYMATFRSVDNWKKEFGGHTSSIDLRFYYLQIEEIYNFSF